MIQPLRTLHRRVMIVLAVVLPAAFVAGLTARRPAPPLNQGVEWQAPPAGVVWRQASVQRVADADVRWRRSTDGDWVEAAPAADLLVPDLLVYWSADEVPSHGRLLGNLTGSGAHRYRLNASEAAGGHLIAFSLAHQAPVGDVTLRSLP